MLETVTQCATTEYDKKLPQPRPQALLVKDRCVRVAPGLGAECQLTMLDQATCPEDMNVTTFGFHALKGEQAGRFSITVSRNWRLTFAFEGIDATEVDLEDYHGE